MAPPTTELPSNLDEVDVIIAALLVIYPALFLSNLMPTSNRTLFYKGRSETQLEGREIETYHGTGSSETHGDCGPIHVSPGTFVVTRSEQDFIQAAAQLGWPEATDLMDLDTNNAVYRNLRTISPSGLRQDAAHCYLHPRLSNGKHPNLHVLVEHQVLRVLFDNKRAVGVELEPNPRLQGDSTRSVQIVRARKMVVVSSGALGTPLVLERSGVGDPEILGRAGVEVVADVPGVGRNYMDHHLLTYPYKSSLLPEETLDALYGGRVDIETLIQTNDKMLGWNAADVTSKVRPSDADVATLGPAFQDAYPGDPAGLEPAQFISVSTFTLYPYSRGHIHITGPKVSDTIDFQTGFFSDAGNVDIKKALWAYKKQREIFRRMDIYRGEWAPGHPPFPAGSAAASLGPDSGQGPLSDVKDIVYTPEDDAVIEKWLREKVGSTWHSMGTCRMAPREETGVVDGSLSVYGVDRLKVVDLSIAPDNVAANTANTAFAIGEKAADLIIEELGLRR
ncbi:related to choline dehydrogenase and related flavoproteins [Cephalotrichum gorgonifer]|uniref:Related to choline dehydrogenase and related flavoproteins n=1 Tax=Cephalotrichum gorgonifer TaxID=2041049 RepID=A0AAE8SSJ9_9PEZI|nr:related to choline dehydrogenase and related flavoproteins [Cephalotrichum gorgonifer]